jgi:hypothetical protein
MTVLNKRRYDLGWVWSLMVAMALAIFLLFVALWFASTAGAAEQPTTFLWRDNSPRGAVESFRLVLSATPAGEVLQEFELDAAEAWAHEIPPSHPELNCGAVVSIAGEGVKTYHLRIRAEAAGARSDWSGEISFTWNFLQTPTDLIIVDVNGPTADVKVFRRYADGKRKLKLFYYGGG